jgi:di/tricarboxylate transporter
VNAVSVAAASLLALLAVIVVSCFSPVNIGLLAIALAFLIGLAGDLPVKAVAELFPGGLFLTLTGVTLLFAMSVVNGTLDQVTRRAVRLARGNPGAIPIVFFFLALALATSGAGNIGATALLAPVAMSVAGRTGISGFLMAMMVANGANAGAFSPFAPTGVIAQNLMRRIGLEGTEWANYLNTLAAQSIVAFAGYVLLGGLRLLRAAPAEEAGPPPPVERLTPRQWLTLGVIGSLFVVVLLFGVEVGAAALVAAVVLSLLRAADQEAALRSMPWPVILMVTGVTVLVGVVEKTGGMALFTDLLARLASPAYVTGVIALLVGIVSVYSSSSGVVLPAFLPAIPGLVERLGGGSPLMIAYSVNVGAHLVDVSPLSTLGALCLAVAPPSMDRTRLFRQLLAWGWSMAAVGALVCQAMFGYR